MYPRRRPQEGSSGIGGVPGGPPALLPSLLLILLLISPSFAYHSPPLLSFLVPWAEGVPGATVGGALEALGQAPYLPASTPGDQRRLQALLESDRIRGGSVGGPGAEEWETPRSPDLFLLTEVGDAEEEAAAAGSRRRRRDASQEAHRTKRSGGFASGGSRIRTGGNGGGFAGSSGMRVGGGAWGPGRLGPQMGGRMSEGPSLSIVNPLDVLRQRLLLEIARRRMRESEDQIQANRELLKSIGKREAGREGDDEDTRFWDVNTHGRKQLIAMGDWNAEVK
ncbi:uncharacterized protein Dh44 [Hetaerina americana]|uniref:uncharacterized protein Dh44 n=1 Tax=Hetaerina americana TaxID=62018 RepID=UPI003A7F14A5